MSDRSDHPGCGESLGLILLTLLSLALGYAIAISAFEEPRRWWHYLVAVPVGLLFWAWFWGSGTLLAPLAEWIQRLSLVVGVPALAIGAGLGLWTYDPRWMVAAGLAFILVALVWGRKADDAFDRLAAAEIFLTGGALAAVGAAKWVIALSVWRSAPSLVANVPSPQPDPGSDIAPTIVVVTVFVLAAVVAISGIAWVVRRAKGR